MQGADVTIDSSDGPPQGGAADFIVTLETHGPLATKRHKRVGGRWQTESYGRARTFIITRYDINGGIRDLTHALSRTEITHATRRFVVRGDTIPDVGIDYSAAPRRLHARRNQDGSIEPATLRAAAHHWIALDIDALSCPDRIDPTEEPDAAVEYAVEHLPPEFHGATCFWQFTASQNIKPGLSLRLWFWSDRKLTDEELKIWLADAPVDPSIFAPAQPIYTAFPIFDGAPDPLPWRCGLWEGDRDEVTPPAIERPQHRRSEPGDGHHYDYAGGGGYDHHRAAVGDHEGGAGFFNPLRSAVAAWFRHNGATADTAALRDDLEQAIRSAVTDPAKHNAEYLEARIRDLDPLIERIRELQAESEAAEAEVDEQAGDPTYPEPAHTLSVSEARTETNRIVDEFTKAALTPPRPGIDPNRPIVDCINVTPGAGKTTAYLRRLVPAVLKAGKRIVISTRDHKTGEERVAELAAIGIRARVYRSRTSDDPMADGRTMCIEEDRTAAINGALGDLDRDACKVTRGKKKGICDHYNTCGYQRQKEDPPEVWIVAHQCLFSSLPPFIPAPDVVVIDEKFHDAAEVKDITLDIDWLVTHRGDHDRVFRDKPDDGMDLRQWAYRVYALLEQLKEPQRLRHDLFHNITAADARKARDFEWRRKQDLDDVYPGLDQEIAIKRAKLRQEHNQRIKALAAFWEYLEVTLSSETELSINLEFSPWCLIPFTDTTGPGVMIAQRLKLHDWVTSCPVLHTDGTMSEVIVSQFFPQATFYNIAVAHPGPDVVFIAQVTDRLMANDKVVPRDDDSDDKNRPREANLEDIRGAIDVAVKSHGKVLVICQQELEKKLGEGPDLPLGVSVAHYGNVRGQNAYSDVDAVVLIGRTEPSPASMENEARLLFGREVAPAGGKNGYYQETKRFLRVRGRPDGVAVKAAYCHPDPLVEALRWSVNEGELVQAAHRARLINRTRHSPLQVYILASVVLPLEIDRALPWPLMRLSLPQWMLLRRGIATNSPSDALKLFPERFKNLEAAKKALQRGWPEGTLSYKRILRILPGRAEGTLSYREEEDSYTKVSPLESDEALAGRARVAMIGFWPFWHPVRSIRYRRTGPRWRPATAWNEPAVIPNPIRWLSEHLEHEVVLADGEDGDAVDGAGPEEEETNR
jgi:hypothetical protein